MVITDNACVFVDWLVGWLVRSFVFSWQWNNFANRPVFDEVMCRLRTGGLLFWPTLPWTVLCVVSMSSTKSNEETKKRRPKNVADGFGVYKFVNAREKLEFDTRATTTTAAARVLCHSVAENTSLHGVKYLRRAKGECRWQSYKTLDL